MASRKQLNHPPCSQKSFSSSALDTQRCLYILNDLLPATCKGLPYPITFASLINPALNLGDEFIFRVIQLSDFFTSAAGDFAFVVLLEAEASGDSRL